MSLFDLYTLAGSALVVALMVGVAYALGFRVTSRLAGEEAVRAALAVSEPDAPAMEIALSADRRAGLARLDDGRWALVRAMGDGVSVRAFKPETMRLTLRKGRLRAQFGELGFPDLDLSLDAPPAWIMATLGEKAA